MLLFGGIFYAILAEGTVQSWADEENKNDSDENASFKFWRKSKQTAILFNFIIKISILLFLSPNSEFDSQWDFKVQEKFWRQFHPKTTSLPNSMEANRFRLILNTSNLSGLQ